MATQTKSTRNDSDDAWLTSAEAAKHIGVALKTIYNMKSQKRLPSHGRGRFVRYRRSELDAWLKSAPEETHLGIVDTAIIDQLDASLKQGRSDRSSGGR